MNATSFCLILLSLILLILIVHSISYFSVLIIYGTTSSHPLILFSFSSQRILLPLILCYFISSYPTSFLSHTTTSYPTFCHFFSSYTTSPHLIVSCCTILILVILFCFLPPHILSYLLCSKTVFSLLILYCSSLSFNTFSYPVLLHLIHAISFVLPCFTTFSHHTPYIISPLFPTYLDIYSATSLPLILHHFFSCCKTSPHLILLSLTLTYFLLSYPASSQCIILLLILYFLPLSYPASFHLVLLPVKPTFCHCLSCFTTSTHSILLHLFLSYFLSCYNTFYCICLVLSLDHIQYYYFSSCIISSHFFLTFSQPDLQFHFILPYFFTVL